MNLYEEIGVDAKATQDEITATYRREAMKRHPDKGGDHDRFVALQRAYDVLGDPERRARYDKTGRTDAQSDPTAILRGKLAGLFVQAAAAVEDPKTNDLCGVVRRQLEKVINDVRGAKVEHERHAKRFRDAAARFECVNGENNLAAQAMEAHAYRAEQLATDLDAQIEEASALIKMLADYRYRVDPVDMAGTFRRVTLDRGTFGGSPFGQW